MNFTVTVTCGGRNVDSAEYDNEDQARAYVQVWSNHNCTIKLVTPTRTYWFTSNGIEIEDGLRVFTTDNEWGAVDFTSTLSRDSEWFDGWFTVQLDSGGHGIYNGERMVCRR